MRSRNLISFVFLACMLVPSLTLAQGGAIAPTIGISPAKVFETVVPGKTHQYEVRLRNLGSDPIPLRASLTELSTIDETGVPVFGETTSSRSARSWITLVNPDIILAAGETENVNLQVTAPPKTAPGGYTAAVVFQASLPSYYFDLDANARILPAITLLVFLSVAGEGEITVEGLKVTDFQVPKIVLTSPVSVVAGVKNPSGFFIQADATATVTGGWKKKSFTQEIGRVIVFPDAARKFVTAVEDRLLPGIYTAKIELKQGDKVLVGSARFVALPWQFLALLFLLMMVVFALAFRRRFKRAFSVLIGKEPLHSPRRGPTLR